jgi:disulfide oxidoreductase YuzD
MRLLLVSLLVLSTALSFAGNIVLEGNYQGKNLYVRNPFAGSGVGFCTYEVTVNGSVTTDEWNSSAFEIDLSLHNLDLGDRIVVVIKHKDDCAPKVLNPEVLNPKSTFETQSIAITNDGILKWSTTNEAGVLTYVIEQYRWNKWVYVGEVEGAGRTGATNNYSFKITPHSGENKFRVKQVDYTAVPRYSPTATYQSSKALVDFNPKKVEDVINFTDETMYEVFDIHGNIVKKGFSKTIDVTNLKKGLYYLNYDNSTSEFMKKTN